MPCWRFLLLPSHLTSSFLHLPVEMASSDESGIEQVIASSSALPNKERHTERALRKKELREFLVIGHTAKQILLSERNALGLRMIETCECLRWWWRTGVVVGKMPASAMIPRVEVEA